MFDWSRLAFQASVIVGALGLAFGIGLYSGHSKNAAYQTAFGIASDMSALANEIPNLAHSRPVHFLSPMRYKGAGVTVNKVTSDDLVLLTGFMGDDQKVELMERDGTVLAMWRLLPLEMLADPGKCRQPPQTDWNSAAHDTIIQPDGSIIFSFESCGMIKLDRCGKKLWATKEITHHSPNFLADGDIIVGGSEYITSPARWPFTSPYWEDLVRKFDSSGRQIMERRISDLLVNNGLAPLLTATSHDETWVDGEFHLNEVEELPRELASAFPMFKPGDLLISLRNLNMILVTDPDVRKIKWYKIGPWIRQHDPDWNFDGSISVFDNRPNQSDYTSRIVAVDPATDRVWPLYGGRPGQHFWTVRRGLHQMQHDGGILITEANGGRAFQVDRSGAITWEYVNRYDEKDTAWLHGAEAYPKSYFTVTDWSCDSPKRMAVTRTMSRGHITA